MRSIKRQEREMKPKLLNSLSFLSLFLSASSSRVALSPLLLSASSKKILLDVDQLDVKDQGGPAGDDPGGPAVAVAEIGRDRQLGALALGELGDALVPALDDLAHAQGEAEGLSAVAGGVELLAVSERARVVDDDGLVLFVCC